MGILKAGTKIDYPDSMAEEIEKALGDLYPRFFDGKEYPESQKEQFQILTLAVAQGVVNHLVENGVFSLIHPAGTEIEMSASGITLKFGSTRLEVTTSGVNII